MGGDGAERGHDVGFDIPTGGRLDCALSAMTASSV